MHFARETLARVRRLAAHAAVTVRADAGFFSYDMIAAIGAHGASYSITIPHNAKVKAAAEAIGEDAWKAIAYTRGGVWVPIIRSWALTRGFALHPGTRNRYEIRYTRTQHRPAPRQANDHGRVSGTHGHQSVNLGTLPFTGADGTQHDHAAVTVNGAPSVVLPDSDGDEVIVPLRRQQIRWKNNRSRHVAYCVASDFARRDPGSFRLHLRWLLALIMEAINDDIDTAEAEADADSRAEVRLVAADADGADLPGRRGSRGWGGPVGDHPAASSCPRWSDRGAAGVEAGPAASVSPGGVGGRGVAGRGRPAPGDGGRAGRRVGGAAGKIALGMSGPVPARVDGTAKAALLSLIDDAVDAGWTLNRACAVVELDRGRAWRWQQRRAGGGLDDARPGGNPIHGLLEWEEAEILALFDEWGDVDWSHRKLAHRGSYEQRVWASPSTVDRVLARHGLALQGAPRPARTVKTPWPGLV